MSRLKILIKGSIGNFNFGDDLLTFSICDYLQSLNIPSEITIISNVNYLTKQIDNINIVSHDNVTGLYDILIYAGGTQFASFNNKNISSKLPTINRIIFHLIKPNILYKKIWERLFGFIPFRYKSLAIIGIGIGPFYKKDKYFNSTITLLKKSDLLAVRDTLSLEICSENSLNPIIGSDLVYSISDSYWNEFRSESKSLKAIAVIIRDWEFSEKDASFIFNLKDIKYKDCEINFISFCENKDIKCIEYLTKNGYASFIKKWDPTTMTFRKFLNELSTFDIFITARYHGAIIASLMRKPFISIGLEPKLTMVAELFEMPCWNYPYNINQFHSLIKKVDENYDNLVQLYNTQLKKEKKKNSIMLNGLNNLLINSLDN